MEIQDYEKKHLEILRGILPECTLFLRRENDAFPIKRRGKIALYGNGARHTIKGGTGSGEVNSRYFVTAEDGLKDAGFTVTSEAWLDAYDKTLEEAKKAFFAAARKEARKHHQNIFMATMGAVMPEPEYNLPLDAEGNTAVYMLSRISGEGNDRVATRGDIFLTETEKRDICVLQEKYSRFMLVLNVGGPVDLSGLENVKNILLLSQLGVDTGTVLADILLGKANPSGKLTTTWAAWEDYCGVGSFGNANDTRYNEGVYVGYRYFDTVGKMAMFPFGFGKSYTEFRIRKNKIEADGETISVSATVTNTGSCAGKEVVQVYVSSPQGRLDKPYQALAGFVKTGELLPEEKEKVTVTFRLSELSSYDTNRAAYILEAGDYVIRLGNSSVDTRAVGVISLSDEVVVRNVKNALGTPDFTDWKPSDFGIRLPKTELSQSATHLTLDMSAFHTQPARYHAAYPIAKEIHALSDEQLARMLIGAFPDGVRGVASVIGSASQTVAGAAGETSDGKADFPKLIMADGPAGLRLSQTYSEEADGAKNVGLAIPETMLGAMPKPLKRVLDASAERKENRAKKQGTLRFQYATAIPIGTAIAQTFNENAAERCGNIVGAEMERFGVHLWLAPALNIHRNIRCGRNFEYYSEDPLISGKFAAAIARGVQAHKGCGVTIKHFAANNQEYNRYSNNSQVSERAMREIYLKGFEICVREGKPATLMTSYNLLNGVHTSERRDLIEDILRGEFGFDGVVMTDWVVPMMTPKGAKYGSPAPYRVAMAGGDLFMPGSRKDYENVLSALTCRALTRQQAETNATRVLYLAKKLSEVSRKQAH